MTTFQHSLVDIIHAAMLLPTRYLLTINETFQMMYCMKFYLKVHQNHTKSQIKSSKKDLFYLEFTLTLSLTMKLHNYHHINHN